MNLYKKILQGQVFLGKARDKVRDFLHINRAQKMQKLHKYLEELFETKERDKTLIKQMIEQSGIEYLDENGDLNPCVYDIPEIKALDEKISAEEREFKELFHKYPDVWEPGEDDVALTYDYIQVQEKIAQYFDEESNYLTDLEQRIGDLEQKTGVKYKINDMLKSDSVIDDLPVDDKMVDLLNEQFYLVELYWDTVATIGDKCGQLLWNSVPKAAKKKYVKFMDDTVVELLAKDDVLVNGIKNFDAMRSNVDLQKDFGDHFNCALNEKLPVPRKIKIDWVQQLDTVGFYRQKTEQINLNIFECKDADRLVGVIKHEFLGHYLNDICPNIGLYGDSMHEYIGDVNVNTVKIGGCKRFVDHSLFISNYNAAFMSHVSGFVCIKYSVPGISETAKETLKGSGWTVYRGLAKPDSFMYQNGFEERTAWALTPTKNIQKKIDIWRMKHGLSVVEKVR